MQEDFHDQPWIILLGADANSGKELIALAIDQTLNPDRYPNGIITDLSADTFLDSQNIGYPQTVFKNFHRPIVLKKKNFDELVQEFKDANPTAAVLIAANIERTIVGEFNYSMQGLESDLLDISIQVYRYGGFDRKLVLTFKNERLLLQFMDRLAAKDDKAGCIRLPVRDDKKISSSLNLKT